MNEAYSMNYDTYYQETEFRFHNCTHITVIGTIFRTKFCVGVRDIHLYVCRHTCACMHVLWRPRLAAIMYFPVSLTWSLSSWICLVFRDPLHLPPVCWYYRLGLNAHLGFASVVGSEHHSSQFGGVLHFATSFQSTEPDS